jgi:16S rRNA processing protein RimM
VSADGNERIAVAYVRRAHGLRGDVLIRPLSDDPDRFVVGAAFQTDESPPRTLEVVAVRPHSEGILLGFRQPLDRSGAEALRGVTLTIDPAERRQLDEDEFWPADLVGLAASDATGAPLGEVTGVITAAAQDRLAVTTPDGRVVEVPFVAAIVTEVDIAGGVIHMDPPPGLFDD